MALKYRINVMESARGWGQKFWTEDFDTFEEAKTRIAVINSWNTATLAPEWYMVAEDTIKAVEV